MPRIRSVHPELFTDEAFVELSMGARVLLIGLGTQSDDQGVFQWKPTGLRLKLFPGDLLDVQELLSELIEADFVRRFADDENRVFGAIRNFCEHQRPARPSAKFPLPEALLEFVKLSKSRGLASEAQEHARSCTTGEERRVEEGRGEEGRGVRARARKSSCPDDFWPRPNPNTETHEATSRLGDKQLAQEVEKFVAFHQGKGNLYLDWQRAWTTWILNAYKGDRGNGTANNETGRNGLLRAASE